MTKPIKIMHLIPSLPTGGAETLVCHLVTRGSSRDFIQSVCTFYPAETTRIGMRILESGIPLYSLGKWPGPDPKLLFSLFRFFRKTRPDILHTHLSATLYTPLPAVFAGLRAMVHTIHSTAAKEPRLAGQIANWVAFHLVGVVPVGVSPTIAHSIEALYHVRHVASVENGIPTDVFREVSKTRDEVRRELGLQPKEPVAIHVGNYVPAKNHALLLRAFAKALAGVPSLTLLLVGDGKLKAATQDLAKELGFAERVRFLGAREDIPRLLGASDLFVFSSDWEGLPMSLLEAMACGLPIVATRVGGVVDILENEQTALLVENGDETGLAAAMVRVLSDEILARRIGKRAQAVAAARFDISQTILAYQELYRRLLGYPPATSLKNPGHFAEK